MIDKDGYRLNVCIVVANGKGQVVYCKRAGMESWQFPQGGIKKNETTLQAAFREVYEELGLKSEHLQILGKTKDWIYYKFPPSKIKYDKNPVCIGQKQIWYLVNLLGGEENIRLDSDDKPEFDDWQWVDYWYPITNIVDFKAKAYKQALEELNLMVL